MKKIVLSIITSLWLGLAFANPNHHLTLLLDWFINPDQAPIFVAQQQGYFKQAGIDVTIIPPADPSEGTKLVLAGKADIAISYELLLQQEQVQGYPLVWVGTLVNQPLDCIVVRQDGPIKTMRDLKEKRIGTTPGLGEDILKTMLAHNGLTEHDVQFIDVGENAIPMLLAGKIDAYSGAMRNVEPIEMAQAGHPARVFYPENNGVKPYAELIFVTRKDEVNSPDIKKFVAAVHQGAIYLKQHPKESWELFAKNHPELNNEFNKESWFESVRYFN
jgi:putative hydroxymethylpyrimidine transport system substrate-binding protein